VAGIIFVSGIDADATADHTPYRTLVERGPADRPRQRLRRGHRRLFISDDDAAAMELGRDAPRLDGPSGGSASLLETVRRSRPVVRKRAAFIDAMARQTGITARSGGRPRHPLAVRRRGRSSGGAPLLLGARAWRPSSAGLGAWLLRGDPHDCRAARGCRVPEDICVAWVHHRRLASACAIPPLATVRCRR